MESKVFAQKISWGVLMSIFIKCFSASVWLRNLWKHSIHIKADHFNKIKILSVLSKTTQHCGLMHKIFSDDIS
jgi:hypothetical protein